MTPDAKPVPALRDLRVKIFSDGADLESILEAHAAGIVRGFTTNPTLMARAGITNYLAFAQEVLRNVTDMPVSFEVFSDEFNAMRRQAQVLAALAENVYVKIPITNTRRESAAPLIRDLAAQGFKLNITAILPLHQVEEVAAALNPDVPAIVSVFAGRIADSGRDPLPFMERSLEILKPLPKAELLWASPREAFNIIQANAIGCHIITVTPELLAKTALFGMDLGHYSLDTVKMFYRDASKSGFRILDEGEDEK